jgi:hypothetical protein
MPGLSNEGKRFLKRNKNAHPNKTEAAMKEVDQDEDFQFGLRMLI